MIETPANRLGKHAGRGMWKYRDQLPLPPGAEPVTLGEGSTPCLAMPRLAQWVGVGALFVKDESANPTGSFKDRGLSVAISLAKHAGVPGVVLPTAGNAGASAAAYAARAGLPVSVHAPDRTPPEILAEIEARGARLTLHPGSISDAGRAADEESRRNGFLSVATFREPGRVEGKKTMAFELLEDLPRLPDAIVYPCGGGTGIVAMARAFDEARALGWFLGKSPRLYAVQSAGCAPVVHAFRRGADGTDPWPEPVTLAAGLCVPAPPLRGALILEGLRRTGGGAVEIADADLAEAAHRALRDEGLLPCPEGAAAIAGAKRLRASGDLHPDETVVVFQTASGLKYLDAWRQLGLRGGAATP